MVHTPTLTAEPDLVTILQTYNDVTERLKRSHVTLLAEVARLHDELHEKNRELQRRDVECRAIFARYLRGVRMRRRKAKPPPR